MEQKQMGLCILSFSFQLLLVNNKSAFIHIVYFPIVAGERVWLYQPHFLCEYILNHVQSILRDM